MEEKYIWDLTHIYNSKEDVYKSIEEAYNLLEQIKVYKGKLKDNSDNIYNVFSVYEKILCLIEKIYGYAMLEFHRDMSNLDAMKLYKKSENLLTESSEIVSFISPELSEMSEESLNRLLQEERFNPYRVEIKDIIKQKKHILSKEIEEVLAKYASTFNTS